MTDMQASELPQGATFTQEQNMGMHGIREALDYAERTGRSLAEYRHYERETEVRLRARDEEIKSLNARLVKLAEDNQFMVNSAQGMIESHKKVVSSLLADNAELRSNMDAQAVALSAEVEHLKGEVAVLKAKLARRKTP